MDFLFFLICIQLQFICMENYRLLMDENNKYRMCIYNRHVDAETRPRTGIEIKMKPSTNKRDLCMYSTYI